MTPKKKTTPPIDVDAIDALLQDATRSITSARALLRGDTPTPPPDVITDNLQAAIDAAAPGSTLTIHGIFTDPITIAKPLAIVTDDEGGATLRGGLVVTGSDVAITGITITKDQSRDDVVVLVGDRITFDRVTVLGDPTNGQKRGIAANGRDITLIECVVDHVWLPGQDTQAVCGWDNTINLTIRGGRYYAAGETILIGGSDCGSEDRQPQRFTLTGALLSKRPEWRTNGASVKNVLELKNCLGATITDNTIEQCWADGQAGYAVVFTPRNQGGGNPYANVTDVEFCRNRIQHVAAFANLLGTDYPNPSGIMARVELRDNTIDDMDREKYKSASGQWGSDKAIQLGDGAVDLTIDHNTFTNTANVGSGLFLYGKPCDRVNITNNAFPPNPKYGTVCGDGTGCGQAARDKYILSGTYEGNTP